MSTELTAAEVDAITLTIDTEEPTLNVAPLLREVTRIDRWHGCRIRWIKRRVERRYFEGWYEGYQFALDNVSDPMVYADLKEYGTGWAGVIERGGITFVVREEDQS